jgi:hypothetical protein
MTNKKQPLATTQTAVPKPSVKPAAAASSKAAPKVVNVDDLIVSRSNRDRRPMDFYDSGNDAANSAAKDLHKPTVPAPPTPPRVQPKKNAVLPPAAATRAPAKQPPPPPPPPAASAGKRPRADGGMTDHHGAPPQPTAERPATPRGAIIRPSELVNQNAPKKKEGKARPGPTARAAARAEAAAAASSSLEGRRLDFDDDDEPPAVPQHPLPATEPALKIWKAALPAQPAPQVSKPSQAAPRHVVTHYMDLETHGVGVALDYAPAAAHSHTNKDGGPLSRILGMLFPDGTFASIDGANTVLYVNARRHRFCVRNVTGTVTVPTALKHKIATLAYVRRTFQQHFAGAEEPAIDTAATAATPGGESTAAQLPAAAAKPRVHRVLPGATAYEEDCVLSHTWPPACTDGGPVFALSAATVAAASTGDIAAATGTTPLLRAFTLSTRSSPYPNGTYYDDILAEAVGAHF